MAKSAKHKIIKTVASDLSCLWEMIMASWGPGGVPFLPSSSRLRDKLGFYSITKRREKPLRLVTLKELCHETEFKYFDKIDDSGVE